MPQPEQNPAEILRAATLDLTRTLNLETVLDALLEHLRRLVPYDAANVLLLDDAGRLRVRAIRGYEHWTDPETIRGSSFDAAEHPLMSALLRSGESLLIPDTSGDPRWQRHAGAEFVRSWIGVPLVSATGPLGLYSLDKAQPGFFTEEHVRWTEAMSPHAALAIQNARLFQAAQSGEERLRALVDNSADVVTLVDARGMVLFSNRATQAVLGYAPEQLRGTSAFGRFHPDDLATAQQAFALCLARPGEPVRVEGRVRHRDGSWRTVEAVAVNRLERPSVGAVVVNYRDVSVDRQARERIESLNRSLERQVAEFRTLLDVLPMGIGIARDPDCRVIEGNRFLNRLMGLGQGDNASFSAPGDQSPRGVEFFRNGRRMQPSEMPMQRAAASGREVLDDEQELVRDGHVIATILGYAAPLFDEHGRTRGAIGVALDITERKRAEQEVRRLAYHDALTGLPNRLLFHDRLGQALAQAHRQGQRLAVLFLDLDRFKLINDSLGHSVGDRLLGAVAARLRTCLREGDTVARLGGDEFTLLLPDALDGMAAAKVAEKVVELLRAPFELDGRELFVTASLGVALYPDDGQDAETLIKHADTAMYRAKERGKDTYELYAPALNAQALRRLALESALRRALDNRELQLHYQPIVELGTGRVCAVEALLRFRHPALGDVSPDEFVPLAELMGLMLSIGPWVLKNACRQLRAWREGRHPQLRVAVNLSARQLQQADLSAQVLGILDAASLPPDCLDLEVTENNAMESPESALENLRRLRDAGVRISIDDFGTGHSSLSYLRRLPIHTLKIDKSFIGEIHKDPEGAAIVTAIIALAHTLRLAVVAEGIEDQQQLEFLRAHGCDCGQGFHLAVPRLAEHCELTPG